jgi:hypothetical protein
VPKADFIGRSGDISHGRNTHPRYDNSNRFLPNLQILAERQFLPPGGVLIAAGRLSLPRPYSRGGEKEPENNKLKIGTLGAELDLRIIVFEVLP